jgi:hypothetical protein
MATYSNADSYVIEIAQKLVDEYHDNLRDAQIAFVFRDEAPISHGRATLGMTKKVSDIHRVLIDFDFIIWLAQDEWDRLTPAQHKALIDHQLCHCGGNSDDGFELLPHDIEEFTAVVERHGLWREDVIQMANVIKQLDFPELKAELKEALKKGRVATLTGEQLGIMTG